MIREHSKELGERTIRFMERFKGKVNRVGKLGINALLLKGNIEQLQTQPQQIHNPAATPPPNSTKTRTMTERKSSMQDIRSSSLQKGVHRDAGVSYELKRSNSMKLPKIRGSKQVRSFQNQVKQKEKDLMEHVRQKLVGTDIPQSTSKNGSKYSQWSYPSKLNENALRFFEFSEGERALVTSRKSTIL